MTYKTAKPNKSTCKSICTNSGLSCSTPTFRFKVVSELSPPFTLDVDETDVFDINDALMIVRYALGIRGANLTASLTDENPIIVVENIERLIPPKKTN